MTPLIATTQSAGQEADSIHPFHAEKVCCFCPEPHTAVPATVAPLTASCNFVSWAHVPTMPDAGAFSELYLPTFYVFILVLRLSQRVTCVG